MLVLFYSIIVLSVLIPICLGILNFKKQKNLKPLLVTLSLCVGVFFAIRYMWGDEAIESILALNSSVFNSKLLNFLALIIVWLSLSSSLMMMLFGFFNNKLTNKIVIYFVAPAMVIVLVGFSLLSKAIVGANAFNGFNLRLLFLAIEVGLVLGYSVFIFIKNVFYKDKSFLTEEDLVEKSPIPFPKFSWSKPTKNSNKFLYGLKLVFGYIWQFFVNIWHSIKWFFKRYWFGIFVGIVIALSVMPAYTLQGLFGFKNLSYTCKDLQIPHRVILYIGIILPFIIHFSLKNQEYKIKRFLLMFICLGTLISFSLNHRFMSFLDPVKWPLHLCNTAMYIMPIVLIFNMKRFFYFTYFINVAGAFLAMVMPNYSATTNVFSTSILIFYINHFIAFFMPILFVSLGMFEKPRLKQFIYSMVGFLGYFVVILIVNALFTGLYEIGKASSATDYFFVNSDFIADKLGTWCENLRNTVAVIKIGEVKLTFYPIYQVLFFLGYVVIGLAVWFMYEQAYQISDSFKDIKARMVKNEQQKVALLSSLKGRSVMSPMYPESENKLILKDFSKKYASSNVYAVKNANLEINGGEIFGFLGPNGAGKSTIIKSIVGIQPITSGEIHVCGYDVEKQSVMAKKNIGFVPDHYALYEKLTGREYINYIADLYGVPNKERNERINMYVEKFELQGAFDNQMKTYSHGMKQKITIMAALVHNPKVWILDEPLTGLDPNSIYQVKECMKEHAKKGNIVFFSSHIIDVVERICDRIAIIKKGNILTCKTLKEIEDSKVSLEDFYMNMINQNAKEGGNGKNSSKWEKIT